MWLDTNNEQDPYNRLTPSAAPSAPNTNVGAGGGAGSPGSPSKGGTTEAGNPSTQTPAQTTGPTQNFATVQDYLGANKQQGEDLGQKVTGTLDQAATADQGAIAGAVTQTANDINQGTVNYDPNLTNKALTDPTKIANDPNQLNKFLGQWNAAYSGPASFETSNNYGTATAANTDAQQKQAEVQTPGGQQQLLSSQFGVYGQGNQGLDQGILQNSSYYPKVQGEAQNFQGVQDYLTKQAGVLDTTATNAQATTDAAKQQTQAAFADNLANFQNQINAETAAAKTPATAQATQFATDFKSGDPTKVVADLKQANPNVDAATVQQYLTALNQQNGKPTDLSQFYSFNPATAITTANAATPQDYANAAAYGKLTGVDYTGVLNPANAAQAGTALQASSGMNAAGLTNYLKTQYENAELSKLGAPTITDTGTPSSPIANVPATPAPIANTPTNLVGNTVGTGGGATVGSGLGGLVAGPVGSIVGAIGGGALGNKISSSISGAINQGENFVNKALGIGGGSKDAVVNLPSLTLPAMSLPAHADPATTKTVIDVFNQPLSTAGSYHEGAVFDMVSRIQNLQKAELQGQLTPQEYATYSKPLIAWATQAAQSIMGASSAAAKSVQPAWNTLQSFIAPQTGSIGFGNKTPGVYAEGGVVKANIREYFKMGKR